MTLSKRAGAALGALSSLVLAFASTAAAQTPDPPAAAPADAPPVLRTFEKAEYPAAALRDGIEGNVGLDLSVDEAGTVTAVKVTSSAGRDLDAAAVAAAKRFVFEPARQGGLPIKATVQFTYEFHLPPPPPTPPPVPPAPPMPPPGPPVPPEVTQTGGDQSTLVLAQRPMSAASSSSVRDRDFQLRPISTVADILRVTPGLTVVQHAGGGKANQYFLRGFDADHGTDIAFSIDGIPINMPSHGHGQGYTDTSFIIPELVERADITKGPYFAEQGDFATAGAVNLVTRDAFEHSSIGFGYGGSPSRGGPTYRGLLIASPKFEHVRATWAAEIGRTDGPFANPEHFDRYKLFNKITIPVGASSTLSLGGSSYAGDWRGSGQIPSREVAAGRLDRFGYLDPTEGGNSARHQLFAQYKIEPSPKSELSAMTYVGQYRLNIVSNFTGFLNDPENGDQITQTDRRFFGGGRASYRVVNELEKVRLDTTIGASLRSDTIRNGLDQTKARALVGRLRQAKVDETAIGAYAKEEIVPVRWLRVIGGARADFFSFAVEDALEDPGRKEGASSGVKGASQMSPKGSVVVTPFTKDDVEVDLFGNYGHGFHSNDGRGVVRAKDPVTALTRAVGYEGGVRGRFLKRLDLAAAVWRLDLASETVWLGDEGTTEASDSTRRFGGELEARYEITRWLAVDADLTATDSSFVGNRGNANAVALAPRFTWAGGVSARHPSGFRGGLRFYGLGDRPATEDRFLTAEGFTVFDLHLGYRTRRLDLALDIENLLDTSYKAAQFATTSRLAREPATSAPAPAGSCGGPSRVVAGPGGNFGGCEDVNFTPGYPITVRMMTTLYLD